jgi:peptide/nickel transport system substrate-binding protein
MMTRERPFRGRRMTMLVLALASSLLLGACTAGSSDSASSGASADQPRSGGTLTFALGADPSCIDPQQTSLTITLNIGAAITDTLTDQDPATGKIVPYLATSWSINSNATQYTFHLRKGVTFSNGTPLNAYSVKANLDSIVHSLGAKAFLDSSYLVDYVGTTVPNEYTAVVNFSKPNVPFLQETATASLGLLANSTLAESANERCQGKLIGSGPFTLASYTEGSEVVLKRRAGYDWPSSIYKHTGEAYLSEIDMPIVLDETVRVGELLSKQVQGISDVEPQDQARLQQAGYTILKRPNPGEVMALFANTTRPLLKDAAIRQAIQLGINRPQIISTLYNSNYPVPTSILSVTTPGYVNLSADLAYNPAKAESLLQADGWKVGPGGIRVKNGQKLVVRTLIATTEQPLIELVQAQLEKIGIELGIVSVPQPEQFTYRAAGDWDLEESGLTRADPDALRRDFDSANWPNSAAHLAPGPLDELLEEQAATTNQSQRFALVSQAETTIVEQGYGDPLAPQVAVHVFSPEVHGVILDASSRLRFYDAWLS